VTAKARYSVRERLGVLALDVPRYLPRLPGRGHWVGIGNRRDRLEKAPHGLGVRCRGRWSADLHACHVFPRLGLWLMRKALREWPIRFEARAVRNGTPDVSFVIPHRGAARVPLLRATIRSILGQRGLRVECLVIEPGPQRELTKPPDGVRCLHSPHPTDPVGWRKAHALNVGVMAAKAGIVVCHDGDMLAPCDYGREILSRFRDPRLEVVHLHRLLFCLGREGTKRTLSEQRVCTSLPPDRVRQNWRGGTLAIRKDAFVKVGGYDEQFVGWGGEDNEFYDRCTTLNGWRYGRLPFVHLWHEPQPEKESRERNLRLLRLLLQQAPEERIARLRTRQYPAGADARASVEEY